MWQHTSCQGGSAQAAPLVLVVLAANGAGTEVLGRAQCSCLGWAGLGHPEYGCEGWGNMDGSEAILPAAGGVPHGCSSTLTIRAVWVTLPLFSTPITGGGTTWPWTSTIADANVPSTHAQHVWPCLAQTSPSAL